MAHQSADARSMPSGQNAVQNKNLNATNFNELFYKVLIVLQTLSPSAGITKILRSEWEEFLDCLSWLCDEKPGGKTVTSIAISESTAGPIVWIACNDKSNDQRVVHLGKIFETLRQLDEQHSASSRESVAAAVAKDCVNRSYRRVLNYRNRLESKLKELESMRAIDDDIGEFTSCGSRAVHCITYTRKSYPTISDVCYRSKLWSKCVLHSISSALRNGFMT
jgi:hypothetical protein